MLFTVVHASHVSLAHLLSRAFCLGRFSARQPYLLSRVIQSGGGSLMCVSDFIQTRPIAAPRDVSVGRPRPRLAVQYRRRLTVFGGAVSAGFRVRAGIKAAIPLVYDM